MAKKRKEKTEEEEMDFKLPKFDEEKFLKREQGFSGSGVS